MRNMLVGFLLFVLFCVIMMGGYAALDLLTTRISNFFATMMQARTAPDIQLTNPLKDVTMDELKADVPTPTEEEPCVTTIIEGTEEFDGKHTLNRELTEREKDLARILLRVAKMAGSKHYALTEPKPDGLMVATVIGVGVEFDGYWVRNKKLAGWEKELVRHLLKLAKDGGGEYEPNEKE